MVAGIGWVRFSAIVGFFFGALVQHMSTAGGNNLITILGYLSLLSGVAWMAGGSGVVGVPGGLLTGFGLGVTGAALFWPPT